MSRKFWRLFRPEYQSWYYKNFVNGDLKLPFGLPGIKCETCGRTWASISKIPAAVPRHLATHPNISDGWPIPSGEHRRLREKVRAALAKNGLVVTKLHPGGDFQPAFLSVPSRPEADFLWPGPGDIVISDRVRQLLFDANATGVVLAPVVVEKTGKKRAKLPIMVAADGSYKQGIAENPPVPQSDKIGPYYDLIVTGESGYPPQARAKPPCPDCGYEEIEWPDDQTKYNFRMTPGMWKGEDFFILSTTMKVVVTNRIRQILEAARVTNVCWEEI